ncbi:MAG: energy-coupling factor transporter transmembrane protein EcfT [Chloroflexi bacterium]|nr:MAG: energy-coupling factor transporter transmembrane protein EcfT [Chloroflexota bacterium]
MQDFELSRNITIGQYIPTGSAIHRLDPRTKLLGALFLIVTISFTRSLIANALLLLVVLLITRTSRIPFGYILRIFRLGLPVLLFIFLMQFLFQGWVEPARQVYWEWGWIRVTRYSLHLITLSFFRITSFVFLTSLITMTATTTELTHGLEQLLRPFRRFGVPAHEVALIFTIAFRFVPIIAEEAERIIKAQVSRGAELSQRLWRPDQMARMLLPIMVPLFLSALRRAEDLILAMEARCYVSGRPRTHFVVLHSTGLDRLLVVTCLLFCGWILLYRWPSMVELAARLGLTGL